ncbi:MAG: hypothetical protein SF053_14945 [Bacteroidia bacterium]|nr:hypothetical protein [Bacteroidia bacterium]
MIRMIFLSCLLAVASMAAAQPVFPRHQLSIHGFRNPSIGIGYQHRQVSVHAGYYLTNFTSGVTTRFVKTGVSYWFAPVGRQEIPSAAYVGVSYLRGLSRDYTDLNAVAAEAGFRWVVWRGLDLRLGAILLAAPGQSPKLNPTPGISYSFTW